MHKILYRLSFKVLMLFLWNLNSLINAKQGNVMNLSEEFQNFLKDLTSIIYKKKPIPNEIMRTTTTINPQETHRKMELLENSQREVLGDMLMMKLISYYEGKYKLTHHEPTTTDSFYPQFSASNFNEIDEIDTKLRTLEPTKKMEQSIRRSNAVAVPDVVVL